MSLKMLSAIFGVIIGMVSLAINGYISYLAFDSLNILDGWARNFAICLAADAISSVLYIMTQVFHSCKSEKGVLLSLKNLEGVLLSLKSPLLVWSIIIWIYTADQVAKSLAMVYAICALAAWGFLGVIVIIIVCVGYNKVSPESTV